MQPKMRRTLALALAALTLAAGGCADTVRGSALRDPKETGNDINVALLDPGNYPTKPRPPLGTAGTAPRGGILESHRMADYVTLPFQVNRELSVQSVLGTGIIQNAAATIRAFDPPIPDGADHHFVAGFTASGKTPGGGLRLSLQNTVLRYASPADADAAVTDMTNHAARITPKFFDTAVDTTPVGIPGRPDTRAVTFGYQLTGAHEVIAFTAHGPYLLGQVVISATDVDEAVKLVADTLAQQQPLIDTFDATPLDKLADLPVDPDGLLARTELPPPEQQVVSLGLYGAHGMLAFDSDPLNTESLFDKTAMDVAARSGTQIYRTRDGAAARQLLEGFDASMAKQGWPPAGGITGLPDARCRRSPSANSSVVPTVFYCLLPVDRYLVEASTGQEEALHQLVSAQYLMLTAK